MRPEIQDLIDGYLDESLSRQQLQQLSQWIKSDPLHARQFAADLMLHDRLRNEFIAKDAVLAQDDKQQDVALPKRQPGNRWIRSAIALVTTGCLVLVSIVLFSNTPGTSAASAAVIELNRIIAANRQSLDRTFRISVEQTVMSQDHRERNSPEHRRPPKPSLDNAILDVRGSNQFVLKRKVEEGVFFITGSNGSSSWAVRPDGPVRFSNDLTRFNRDLPGHERSLPINNLDDGLDALDTAYDLNVLPVEGQESDDEPNAAEIRRMVAVKKPDVPGPARIEITYTASSGQIRQMRFVEMPYGQEIVTLTMTLIDEQKLAADYFDHQSHHDPERIVEFE